MPDQASGKNQTTELHFETDHGSRKSTWTALAILLIITAWMASGFVFPTDETDKATGVDKSEKELVAVSVRTSVAKPVTLYFQAEGQAQPVRATSLRTETAGDVAEVRVEKGDDVEEGEVIARLTTNRAEADLSRAREEEDRARREFENAQELLDRGVATLDRLSQARATLAAAEAQVTTAKEALESTVVAAPFDGRIETLILDEGEFFSANSEVGRIVDIDPLIVEIRVPQQMLSRIENRQTAQVSFITGETREGTVSFIGSAAATDTRTFLAEIEVPNVNGVIPAGISADVRMVTGQENAHFVSPSVISLNPEGALGIKTVVDGIVEFHEVRVVRSQVDGLWVTGLPDEVELITIGQGFVRAGDAVRTRPEPIPEDGEGMAEEAAQ